MTAGYSTGMAITRTTPYDTASPIEETELRYPCGDRRNTPFPHPGSQSNHEEDSSLKRLKRRSSSERFREFNRARIMDDSANLIKRVHCKTFGDRYPLPPLQQSKSACRRTTSLISSSSSECEIRNHSLHNQTMFLPNLGVLHNDKERQVKINSSSELIPAVQKDRRTADRIVVKSSLTRLSKSGFALLGMLALLLLAGLLASLPTIYSHAMGG